MAHRWTDDDDKALSEAVEACLSMQETMRGNREVWCYVRVREINCPF